MKKLWKILLPAFVLCLCVLLLPTKASAATIVSTGTCGANLTWTLDDEGTLTISGTGAMKEYSWGITPFNYNSNIKAIVIEDGVTSIGYWAFDSCSNLTNVTIGNSVTSIGYGAFYGCSSLTSITIPDSVTSIGNEAFRYCSSLTSVTIGNSVTSIGSSAFFNCSSLTGIWVDENNPNYSSDTYGVLFNKEKTELICVPGAIVEYVIPDSVTSIGGSAFSHCSSLTSITIPDSVTSIGNYAFYNCSSLTSVTIPDSVTSIGDYAFRDCSSLTSITIPDSVTSIGSSAFSGCSSLTGIWVDENNPNYSSDTYGVLFNKEKTELIWAPQALTEYVIPDSVTSIGFDAFSGCSSLTSVTIPDSVTSIGNSAFEGCSSLTSITIPDSVTSIGSSAFGGCSSLTSITIPDRVTSIVWGAFGGCSSLTSITIGNSVTSIDAYAFSGCSSLTSITVPDSVTSIGYSAFSGCSSLTSVTIGVGVTSIGDYAFYDCGSLTSITIPDKVTRIGEDAFFGCSELKRICISDLAAWMDISFAVCTSNPLLNGGQLYLNGKVQTNITVPNGITAIKPYAFYGYTNLKTITIPDSVTGIGDYAFYDCGSLTSITIPDSVTGIGDYAFYDCGSLTSITIPDSVTSIGDSAFEDCSSLTSITIPDSVTSIGKNAFYGCSKLQYNTYGNAKYLGNEDNPYLVLIKATSTNITSCEIHSKTKVICSSAFSGCSSLTSITIPDSVTSIGSYAFANCWQLTDVYYCGTQEQWNCISVSNGNSYLTNATLHLHTHSYDTCVVNVQPTFTSEGSQTKTCSCGDSITEVIPQLVARVKEWNVALGGDLTVNFYLEVSDYIMSTAKVQLMTDDRTVNTKVSDLEKTADGLYKISIHMAATQMNEVMTVIVKNGREIGHMATYTIRDYCDTLLADESASKYHALIKEMLNYGAAAQAYFGYESDGAANEGITGAGQTPVPESAPEMSVSGTAGSVRFYGASLVYESKIAVRFYFSGDVSDCSFAIYGRICTPVAKNGLYYVELDDILPQNLGNAITVTVTSGEEILRVSYSPMTYIVRMNAKGTETLQALMCALYNYHLAAKDIHGTWATDPVEIVKAAYALTAGDTLPYEATLTGTVTEITTAYDADYANITVIIEVEGTKNMPIKCYRMKGDGIEKIAVGDTITVTGYITNYQYDSGDTEVGYNAGCQMTDRISGEVPTEPEEQTVIQGGTMSAHANGWASSAESNGGLYFTMAENEFPYVDDWSIRLNPLQSSCVKLIRDGETYEVGNTGAGMIVKYSATEYYLEFWPMGNYKPLLVNDILVVEGDFVDAASGVLLSIDKTYIKLQNGMATFSTEYPTNDEDPEELNAGNLIAAENIVLNGGTGFYFGMSNSSVIPTNGDDNWDNRFMPTSADTLKLIRDGVTTSIGNTAAGEFVKYSETGYYMDLAAWSHPNVTPFVSGDVLVIEGYYTNGTVVFKVEKSIITIGEDGNLSFTTDGTGLPDEKDVQAGRMSCATMTWNANDSGWFNNNTALYFALAPNDVPASPDWDVEYSPERISNLQLTRDGETYNIGILGRGTVIKVENAIYVLKLETWTIGEYAPLQVGDVLTVEGRFVGVTNANGETSDYKLTISKTQITIGEDYVLSYTNMEDSTPPSFP